MTKAFISHSSSDQNFLETILIPLLKEVGIDYWYSKIAIPTAADWERSILKGLEISDWFILVLSPRSVVSRWVKTEVHWAFEHRPGRVVPILIEPCDPVKLHIGLQLIQHVDFTRNREEASAKLRAIWVRTQSFTEDDEPILYNPPPPAESALLNQVKNEAIMARVMDMPFDFLMFYANFNVLRPKEAALLVLGNQLFTFRVDFDDSGVTLSIEGSPGFYAPLPPAMVEVNRETSQWMYIVELRHLQQVNPMHPLAHLSPRNLENIPVQLLLDDQVYPRLSTAAEAHNLFRVTIVGEVSGYLMKIFSNELTISGDQLKTLRFPRSIQGKPGFFPIVLPDWKSRLELSDEPGQLSLRDPSRAIDNLERQQHIESWRGIWPDLTTHQFFHRTHKVPFDESTLVFHPWNERFVRLRTEFEQSCKCSVPGIAAFQLQVANSFFYLFTTISFQGNTAESISFTKDGNDLHLSSNEMVAMLNILGQLAILNHTWVEAEGNYIQGLCVLLPPRRKYVILSSKLYYEYRLRHPKDSTDFVSAAEAILTTTITLIKDLP